jgi:hypothetical protein
MGKFVVFDKKAVDRYSWSALLNIGFGLEINGKDVEYFTPSYFRPYDKPLTEEKHISGVFTWNFNYQAVQDYYRSKTDVYIADQGFLSREEGYNLILKNYKFLEGKDNSRFNKLGLKIRSTWSENGHILVCLQNHHRQWYTDVLRVIHDIKGSHKIRLRNFDEETDLREDLRKAFAVVTYNSTCLYPALLNKIPVFCSEDCPASKNEDALSSKAISTKIQDINLAKKVEHPEQFLYDVAYNQYTLKELSEGVFIDHLVK